MSLPVTSTEQARQLMVQQSLLLQYSLLCCMLKQMSAITATSFFSYILCTGLHTPRHSEQSM